MNKPIRKAIIPAAGLGTRFLPATKAMPKEMLPIVDTPTVQYIVQEAVNSGIEEILIITNANKHSMENHFDRSFELEYRLHDSGKLAEEKLVCDIAEMANIYYVRQKEPKGLGHAVLCARSFIGNEPFAVLLGDDVVLDTGAGEATKQLMDCYHKVGASVLGVQSVPESDVSKYGIVALNGGDGNLHRLTDMIEKPALEDAPSRMAVLGRYILTPEIFDFLATQTPGKGGEIQLTDSIRRLMTRQQVYACEFEGSRYDVGDKFGFIKATIDFALRRADLKDDVGAYIKQLAGQLTVNNYAVISDVSFADGEISFL